MDNAVEIKLEKRLPNLTPEEERVFTEAIMEAYLRGIADAQPPAPTTVIIHCKYFLPPDKYEAMAAELAEQLAAGGALILSPALEKVAEVPRSGKLQIVAEVNYGTE